jgi:hypothetical protein
MKSTYLTFSLFHNDIEYRVSGLYTPPDPGQTLGPPEKCWPPEDHSFEIDEAHPVGDEFYDMPGWLCETLDALALEKAAEIYHDQKDF